MATRSKKSAAAPAVAEVIARESAATLVYSPIRLCDLDHKSQAHLYCHRKADALAYSDDPDSFMSRLIESLLSEGQQIPVEYARDETGAAILIRGYQRTSAIWHIIERNLDPEHFSPEMMLEAMEVRGASKQDLIIRSISDNEVRRNLDDEEVFITAGQAVAVGASAQRTARALGMSATQFARIQRRIRFPALQAHVTAGHLTQTDLDNLLEVAASKGQISRVEAQVNEAVAKAKTHVELKRAQATAAGEEFDAKKSGDLGKLLKSDAKRWAKAVKDNEVIAWTNPDQADEGDHAWICKFDSKEATFKVAALKVNLHKASSSELAKITFKLAKAHEQSEKWLRRRQAEEGLAQAMVADDEENFADFLERHDRGAEAAKVRAAMASARGEDDPSHGAVPTRDETDLTGQIEVPPETDEVEYDPMIDETPPTQ